MQPSRLPVAAYPLLAAILLATGCGSKEPVDVLADEVPVEQQGVSTDVIHPEDQTFKDLFGQGWEPLRKEVRRGHGRLVVERTARVRLYAAVAGAHTLELDALTPIPPPKTQTLSVSINNRPVGTVTLTGKWQTHEIALPASAVRVGWNRLELQFSSLLKGPGATSDRPDKQPVAASVRRIGLRSPLERAVWAERPNAIQVTSDTWGASLLEMPADSLLDVYVQLGRDPRLAGTAEATFTKSTPSPELNGAVDLIDRTGRSHTLFERKFAAPGRESFEIPLDKWANSIVRFRLRSWGRSNGIVRWRDTGLRKPAGYLPPPLSGELQSPPGSNRLGQPHVVVFLLDTARADFFDDSRTHLTMKHVAALADGGTRFTEAWAPSAWTGQSVPSIITGWYPQAMGIDDWGSQIPESVPTLAELMAKAGYHTVLWSQHNIWRGNSSLRRGFEAVHVRPGDAAMRDSVPAASDLFVDKRPTFAFVHLLPPHGPYAPPKPFRGMLTAGTEANVSQDWIEMDPGRLARTWSVRNRQSDAAGAEMLRYIRARYDENGLYADHLVGRVVESIRAAGQHDNTLIVILADHGEGFLEHRRFFHQSTVYQEVLHIPFVVKWPASVRGFARVVSHPVSLVDLVPTLVDGVAPRLKSAPFQGQTLLPLVLDGASPERDVFASTRPDTNRDMHIHALRAGRYKVIYNNATSKTELYDLEADPGEKQDIAGKDPLLTGALLQRLLLRRAGDRVAMSNAGGGQHNPIKEETMRALRALGYVR